MAKLSLAVSASTVMHMSAACQAAAASRCGEGLTVKALELMMLMRRTER